MAVRTESLWEANPYYAVYMPCETESFLAGAL